MRRFLTGLITALVILSLAVTALGAAEASHMGAYATVSSDGSCSVAMTVTVRLEQPGKLTFPVPRNASNITVNGSRVRTQVTDTARVADLSGLLRGMAGEFTFTVNYRISDAIYTREDGVRELQVPILSGFSYPIATMDFSVTLPGAVEEKPHFVSGYHQADIEQYLSFSTEGASVSGTALQALKDHETLMMTLPVSEEMFPKTEVLTPDMAFCNMAMAVCAALAVLYWLLFLRNGVSRAEAQPVGPEGYGAGQLGSVLTLRGADLTMMAFSWAKLGYLQITRQRRGDVVLHKQMDMGNERSDFERQVFRKLFSRRLSVSTSGTFYAELSNSLAKQKPQLAALMHPRTGNRLPFRILAALVGLFGGVNLGIALSSGAALKWFLTILLAAGSFAGSYFAQNWAEGLLLRDRRKLYLGLFLGACWLILSFAAGDTTTGFVVFFAQIVFGLMHTFGGRRTEAGRQAAADVLGLRRYLMTVSPDQLQHICRSDPEYFFSLAPEAMALGLDRIFAKRFGSIRMPECPYLHMVGGNPTTARQWSALLRDTAQVMDETARALPYRRALSVIRGFIK